MSLGIVLISLGCLMLVGLGLDAVGRRTKLPRITLLVLFGLAVGPHGANLLPLDVHGWYDIVAKIALTLVAFLLGGALSKAALTDHGRAILTVSLAVTIATAAVMAVGLWAVGVPVVTALLLAGVGLATDPAATRDVATESGAQGSFTRTVLGVVAIDDAWAVIAFSILLGLAANGDGGIAIGLQDGLIEVTGALLLGLAIGLPGAYATGRVRPGEPTLIEAIGIVLLCAGLALWLEVSFLLVGMTAGAAIVNLARHHDRAFHEIEHVGGPVLIVFFVFAGAAVDVDAAIAAGGLGAAFVAFRLTGRFAGGWIGGRIGGLPSRQSLLIGLALTPQAGVALGMALVASESVPAIGGTLLTITVATTVFFELLGPILTRLALRLAGEIDRTDAYRA